MLLVPQEGFEPSRLSALVPKTSVSTVPPPGQKTIYMEHRVGFEPTVISALQADTFDHSVIGA